MLRPDTTAMMALLGLLGASMPLTMDMYLASLPDIARTFGATSGQVQLTIAAYLIGAAIGTMTYGPLADRFGRKPILIVTLVVYCTGSIVCAFAPSLEVLLGGRLLQALGPSGTVVVMRAIVRDMYEGTRMGRRLSQITTLTACGPLVASPIGGILQTAFGWRAVFITLICYGAILLTLVITILPETIAVRTQSLTVSSMLRSFRTMLGNRVYVSYIAIMSVTGLGMMSWLSGATFVLQDIYGLSPLVFGFAFLGATGGYVVGAALAARYVMRLGIDRAIGLGSMLLATGGIVMVIVVSLGIAPGWSLVFSMTVYMLGVGFVFPQSQTGALSAFRSGAGAASSLAGFIQQTGSALLGILLGPYLAESPVLLACAIALAGCTVFTLWLTTRRVRTAGYPES